VLSGSEGRTPLESWWDSLLHRRREGTDVQLTLDSGLQATAQDLLGDARGAAVLLDAITGEVLVLASSPSYDPNVLDDDWVDLADDPEGPLLNRATQGLYQPGSVIHTAVLAEVLSVRSTTLGAIPVGPDAARPVAVDGLSLQCGRGDSDPETLAEAYARSCPSPITQLAEVLGTGGIADAIRRWALDSAPGLEIPAAASAWDISAGFDLRAEALGQGTLVLSPLRVATIAATLGADGTMPSTHLVRRVQGRDGRWVVAAPPAGGRHVVSPAVASDLLGAWALEDQGRARARAGTAIAGEGQRPHSWYAGVASVAGKVYAVAVLVEHAEDEQLASSIGLALLQGAVSG
jgi:peptidoglycan glycosyltransferase